MGNMLERDNIRELFEQFKGLRVLILGDVMIDAYLWGKVERISPEAPVPVVALKKRENRMGGAANVALNIQGMGATPILCSVIGKDEKGAQFLDLLKEKEMTCAGILESSQRITTIKYRIIGNNAQLLRVDEEQEQGLAAAETQALFEGVSKMIKAGKADVVVFEDYDKGVITPALIHQVTSLAHEYSIPVVVDPKKKNFLHYRDADLFKPNLKELREGLKLDSDPETNEATREAIGILQKKLGARMVMATLSDKGIVYLLSKNSSQPDFEHIPAHFRQIADVSGAGDTVISIAALCLAAGASATITARLANLAGGLVCEHVGVVPVNREQLLQEALEIFSK